MEISHDTIDIRDPSEAIDAIKTAASLNQSLAVEGAGTKQELGRYRHASQTLSLKRYAGVTLYEPEELVMSARAGTTVREIEALLERNNQHLAFEPINYNYMLGMNEELCTIGGVIAVNASGPRRIKTGAARDHLLGFYAINGLGECVKSGGRVMKNVTGFDLSKLICGSYGTLALITDVTLKVMPKPETEQTLLLRNLSEHSGLVQLRRASASPYDVSAYAMIPAGMMQSSKDHITALRIEGPEISVMSRTKDLLSYLDDSGAEFETLASGSSSSFWKKIKDAQPIAKYSGQIWRLSVAPSAGFEIVQLLKGFDLPLQGYFYDWAGGLIWLAIEPTGDAHESRIRAAVNQKGGHATLIRAGREVRSAIDVFHPQEAPLAALSKRIKEAFDPDHVLERGRMRAGF